MNSINSSTQVTMFYDDAYDAIEKSIAASGRPKKELAAIIYPGRTIETAKSLLARALSPENTDVHLSIEAIMTILKETRADDFIFYLCDEFGFERPIKKSPENFKKDIKSDLRQIAADIKQLNHKIDTLERLES